MLELLEPSSQSLLDFPSSSPSAAAVKETFLTTTATEDDLLDIVSAVMFTTAIVIMIAKLVRNNVASGKGNVCLYERLSAAAKSFQYMLQAKLVRNDTPLDEHDFENLGEYNPDEDPLYRRVDVITLLHMRPKPEKSLPKGALHTEADPHQLRRIRSAASTGPTAFSASCSSSTRRAAADLECRSGVGPEDRWSTLRRKPLLTTRSAGAGGAPGLIQGPPGLSTMEQETNMSGASALLATVLHEEPVSSAAKPGSLSRSVGGGLSLRPMGGSLSSGIGSRPARKAAE